jgi:uncharacterized lipoprotein YmbA
MIFCRYIILLFIICLGSLLSGCFGTSKPTRFYTLSPPENHRTETLTSFKEMLVVGPLTIPEYLDRRQIVSRSGQNGIVLAEFEQWSSSLDDELTRLLVATISENLVSLHVAVLSGMFSAIPTTGKMYRIPIKIVHFHGYRGGTVVLNAFWGAVENQEGHVKYLFNQESTITEIVTGNSYEALVDAMGRAARKLAMEIASRFAAVITKK